MKLQIESDGSFHINLVGDRPTGSGIYLITNTVNGKTWVGQAANIWNRWSQHLSKFRASTNSPKLQAAWDKYGPESFEFTVLEFCDRDGLVEREAHYMAEYKSAELGYNLEKFDRRGKRVVSEETKRKTSMALIGVAKPNKENYKRSESDKRRISEALKGRPKPEGWGKGENNPNFGKRGADTSSFGSTWYMNPDTGESKKLQLGVAPPDGWIKGRKINRKLHEEN